MIGPLTATIEPMDGGEDGYTVILRVTNASDADVSVLNPDMGRPSEWMRWPYSLEVYRMSLLLSFGFLAVSVVDSRDEQVEEEALETWATPVLKAPLTLSPGERYRLTVENGDKTLRVAAEGVVDVPGT